jgi:hypothetical protein
MNIRLGRIDQLAAEIAVQKLRYLGDVKTKSIHSTASLVTKTENEERGGSTMTSPDVFDSINGSTNLSSKSVSFYPIQDGLLFAR